MLNNINFFALTKFYMYLYIKLFIFPDIFPEIEFISLFYTSFHLFQLSYRIFYLFVYFVFCLIEDHANR